MRFNNTPPPKPTPAPNSSIFLPLVLVLGTMGFAVYKIMQSMPEEPKEPVDPLVARYGTNRMPNWHPTPYKHIENVSRSPCPLLNTLANHGYLPRNGRNIDRKTLGNALDHLNVSPTVRNFLVNAVSPLVHPPPGTAKDAKLSDDEMVFDLSDLQQHGFIEHDVSLTRHDYHPSLDKDRHWRADKALVEQLKGFADKDGFLTYEAIARARNLRQKQCDEESAMIEKEHKLSTEDDTRPVNFGVRPQFTAHAECCVLVSLLGRNGKIHKSNIDEFMLNERFPKDWAPPSEQFGLIDFFDGMIKCVLYRYLPRNWSPSEPELVSNVIDDEKTKSSDSEHVEL